MRVMLSVLIGKHCTSMLLSFSCVFLILLFLSFIGHLSSFLRYIMLFFHSSDQRLRLRRQNRVGAQRRKTDNVTKIFKKRKNSDEIERKLRKRTGMGKEIKRNRQTEKQSDKQDDRPYFQYCYETLVTNNLTRHTQRSPGNVNCHLEVSNEIICKLFYIMNVITTRSSCLLPLI